MDYGKLVYRRGTGPNALYVLHDGSNMIGSDPRSQLALDDTNVSRLHARIICVGGESKIEDLRSAKGTLVNGERLAAGASRVLQHGDLVVIGPYTMRYILTQPSAEPPKPPKVSVPPPRPPEPPPQFLSPPRYDQLHIQDGKSSYFQFLPPFYRDTDSYGVLNALLLVCETILEPLDRTIDQLHYYFNPHTAPDELLPWLATWVNVVLNENWPPARRRALISQAADLYRWRGTHKGLHEYLRIYTGAKPTIIEPGQESKSSGEQALPDHVFRVVVEVDDPTVEESLVRQIIEAEKPAHTSYYLVYRQRATSP